MLTVVTPASSSDLTTVAAVKAELNTSSSADDTHLGSLVTSASKAIAEYCGRPTFGRATVQQTERLMKFQGDILLDWDINVSITSVTVDGVALATDEYELDGSILYRLSDDERIDWEPAKVVIVYQAGYSLPSGAPESLARACVITVSTWFLSRGRNPLVRSHSVEGVGQTSYLDPKAGAEALPPNAVALLADLSSPVFV